MRSNGFRSSPKIRRLGVAIMGLFTVVYLALISRAYIDQLNSTKRIVVFSMVWLLGIVALALLARAWRHFGNLREKPNTAPPNSRS